jgi:DDE superfamily endonuclease
MKRKHREIYNDYTDRLSDVRAFLRDACRTKVAKSSRKHDIPTSSAYDIFNRWKHAGRPEIDKYTPPPKRRPSLIGHDGDAFAGELITDAIRSGAALCNSAIAEIIYVVEESKYRKIIHTRRRRAAPLPRYPGRARTQRLKRMLKLASGTPRYRVTLTRDLNTAVSNFRTSFNNIVKEYRATPHLVINGDQTLITSDTPLRQVLRFIGKPAEVKGDTRSHLTIAAMACTTFAGERLPLYVLTSGTTDRSLRKFNTDAIRRANVVARVSGKKGLPWFNWETVIDWMYRVVVPYTKNHPALLLLDAARIHEKPHVAQFCHMHNITILPIPAHTTHLLQPLDVGVFGPCKSAMKQKCSLLNDFGFDRMTPTQKLVYRLDSFVSQFVKLPQSYLCQTWKTAVSQ